MKCYLPLSALIVNKTGKDVDIFTLLVVESPNDTGSIDSLVTQFLIGLVLNLKTRCSHCC
jgi:hypothetical protein